MSPTYRSRPRAARPAAYSALVEIAEVLDLVATCRAGLYADAAADDGALRAALFALLDQPTQENWEKVREVELVPSYLPGLTTPSPLGLTLGDIVYAYGIADVKCPSRSALLRVLRRAATEHGLPTPG